MRLSISSKSEMNYVKEEIGKNKPDAKIFALKGNIEQMLLMQLENMQFKTQLIGSVYMIDIFKIIHTLKQDYVIEKNVIMTMNVQASIANAFLIHKVQKEDAQQVLMMINIDISGSMPVRIEMLIQIGKRIHVTILSKYYMLIQQKPQMKIQIQLVSRHLMIILL